MNEPATKIYFVCLWNKPSSWHCVGVTFDGFIFGQRACSRPAWAPNDLLFNNLDAQRLLKEKYHWTRAECGKFKTLSLHSVADFVMTLQSVFSSKTYEQSAVKNSRGHNKTAREVPKSPRPKHQKDN
jgi:hypothetical protein